MNHEEPYRVFPTHTNLIHFKQRLQNSIKGLHFLERKRDVLMMHARDIIAKQNAEKQSIVRNLHAAVRAIDRAKFIDVQMLPLSIHGYESAAAEGEVTIKTKNLVGILVPHISFHIPSTNERSLTGLSKGGEAILNLRETFGTLIRSYVETVSLLQAEMKIMQAVHQTSIRTNALQYMIIPRTSATVAYIKAALEEMAREDFYRIKKIMGKKKANEQEKLASEETPNDERRIDTSSLDERLFAGMTSTSLLLIRDASRWSILP